MSYLDEDFLKLKRREKYAKYSTLETGIYIKDELVEFEPRDIPELNINASLPKTFVRMPLSIAKIKYPSADDIHKFGHDCEFYLQRVSTGCSFGSGEACRGADESHAQKS